MKWPSLSGFWQHHITVEALLSPWGAYLILDTPEGGLLERGGLIQNVR